VRVCVHMLLRVDMHLRVCVCVHALAFVCLRVQTRVLACASVRAHVCKLAQVCVHVCKLLQLCVHVCKLVRVCVHMHVPTHMYVPTYACMYMWLPVWLMCACVSCVCTSHDGRGSWSTDLVGAGRGPGMADGGRRAVSSLFGQTLFLAILG
jgi:hypothetical protein